MEAIGGKWKYCAKYLSDNEDARVLCFVNYYNWIHDSYFRTYVILSSNPNEYEKARIKNTPEYKLPNGKGLSVVEIVSLLQEIDASNYKNLVGANGRKNNSKSIFRRVRGKLRL